MERTELFRQSTEESLLSVHSVYRMRFLSIDFAKTIDRASTSSVVWRMYSVRVLSLRRLIDVIDTVS